MYDDARRIQFFCYFPGLGDKLCNLVAVRAWAKAHPDCKVVTEDIPDVVAAYNDCLVTIGVAPLKVSIQAEKYQRGKNIYPRLNYMGTFLKALDLPCEDAKLVLPAVEPILEPRTYAVVQPYSVYAEHPTLEQLQQFIACFTTVPLIAVGKQSTPKDLPIDYSYLGPPLNMLRLIAHAKFVLTCRSASVNIAAAYNVPACVWIPDDDENWNMNFSGWPHWRVPFFKSGALADVQHISSMLLQQDNIHALQACT